MILSTLLLLSGLYAGERSGECHNPSENPNSIACEERVLTYLSFVFLQSPCNAKLKKAFYSEVYTSCVLDCLPDDVVCSADCARVYQE